MIEILREIERLKKRINELESRDGPPALADYSSTSTVNGWTSFTYKKIYYAKFSQLVFVMFFIQGTSNATNANFTVPFAAATWDWTGPMVAADNGTWLTNADYYLPNTSQTVALQVDPAGTNWTNSGTKICQGQFWYKAA